MTARTTCSRSAADGTERERSLQTDGRFEPLLPVPTVEVHRLLALRPRLRRSSGHVRADDRPDAALLHMSRPAWTSSSWHRNAFRAAPAYRRLPDRDAHREVGGRHRPAEHSIIPDMRVLRRRMFVQGRDARRRTRSHGAVPARKSTYFRFVVLLQRLRKVKGFNLQHLG